MTRLPTGITSIAAACAALIACALGCTADTECQRVQSSRDEVTLHCPRNAPVTLSAPPSREDAPCILSEDGGVIACGEDRYVASTGELIVGDAARDSDATGDGGEGGDPGQALPVEVVNEEVQRAPTRRQVAGCAIGSQEITCAGGARAEIAQGSLAQTRREAICEELVLPGVGRRVVCHDGKRGGLIEVLEPSGGSVAARERDAACVPLGDGSVGCGDGSVFTSEEVARAIGEGQACEDPRFEALTPAELEVRARCVLSMRCDEEDRYVLSDMVYGCDMDPGEVARGLGPECLTVMTPRLVCGDDAGRGAAQVSKLDTPCFAPLEGLSLSSARARRWLEDNPCLSIRGDVTLTPGPLTGAQADLRFIEAITGVKSIEGSLIIEDAWVPGGVFELEQLEAITQRMLLERVMGDVSFARVDAAILPGAGPKHIGGKLRVEDTGVEELALIAALYTVGGDILIQGNIALREVPTHGDTGVGGMVVFVGNPGVSACEASALFEWAIKVAQGALFLTLGRSISGC